LGYTTNNTCIKHTTHTMPNQEKTPTINKEINMDWSCSWISNGGCWNEGPLPTKKQVDNGGYHLFPYPIIWMVKQGTTRWDQQMC